MSNQPDIYDTVVRHLIRAKKTMVGSRPFFAEDMNRGIEVRTKSNYISQEQEYQATKNRFTPIRDKKEHW